MDRNLIRVFSLYGKHVRKYARQSRRSLFGSLNDFWKNPVTVSKTSGYEIVKPGSVSALRVVPSEIQRPDYSTKVFPKRKPEIKPDWQIEGMRQAGALARKILTLAMNHIEVGMTTDDIDSFVHGTIVAHGAYPAPLLYKGFPKSICTSVNNVACHGIPDDRPLLDGDIVNIDITVYYRNFHGDCSDTFLVGNVDEPGRKLVEVARLCRDEAIAICKPGQSFSEIGKTISTLAKEEGFRVVRRCCGHGIGTYFHGPPQIVHHENTLKGTMKENMTFTIEPVISEGSDKIVILDDGWTAVSIDNSRSAQFEHTILITKTGAEILTS